MFVLIFSSVNCVRKIRVARFALPRALRSTDLFTNTSLVLMKGRSLRPLAVISEYRLVGQTEGGGIKTMELKLEQWISCIYNKIFVFPLKL